MAELRELGRRLIERPPVPVTPIGELRRRWRRRKIRRGGTATAVVVAAIALLVTVATRGHTTTSVQMAFPPGRTVVAVDGDVIVGTATMGPNRAGRGGHVATASFMVDPRQHNHGVGRAMGIEVIDWARREGFRAIQFNAVVETNEAAVHLWESLGFEVLCTVPGAFRHADLGFVGLHVMYLRLS